MDKALELFTAVPKQHNCAQAVVCGLGRNDLANTMSACGGGRAPEGVCGAIYGAMQIVPQDKRETLLEEFRAACGAVGCRELKAVMHVPCTECVKIAAELAGKYL